MKRLLAVALATLAFAACKKSDSNTGDDDMQAGVDSTLPATTTDVTTDVTTNTTWSGLIRVHAAINVVAGVTLDVEAGSVIQFDGSAGIVVAGTVNVNGAKGNVVTVQPAPGGHFWRSWGLASGTLNMTYVQSKGGGFSISGTGTLKARDSEFSNTNGDLLVASGGTIDMQYSWIGLAEGMADTTHCDIHFEGGNPSVIVSHSNISTSSYGIMFYAGQTVDMTYNNWFGNSIDVDKHGTTSGDISNSYFKKGNPTGSGLTANNMATAMITDAGPR
ncbi:MAG: hypothetical protein ABI678_10905 [Kofleriaceae bacterium]